MQAVILAAGKGKRMEELTSETPKPMLSILGKPVLEYKLENLPEEIDEVIFVVNYLRDVIENHFGEEFKGRKIKYAFQEELSGTGGSIHSAKDLIQGKFLVLMGDDLYSKEDLKNLIKNDWAILAKEVADPENFGVLEVDDQDRLVSIIEKPKNPKFNLANTGAYVMQKDFFDFDLVPVSETEFGLPQTLASLPFKNEIKVERASFWQPINNKEEFILAQKIVKKLYP